MMIPRLRVAILFATIAAAGALGVAFASEWYGGLVPCALCLVERWPYRIAIDVGVLCLLLPRAFARVGAWLLVLIIFGGAAVAFVHVGVENKAWPSPLPECAAPTLHGDTMAERLASMPAKPSKSCEDPTYPVAAIPISFATMNLLYALVLSGGLATFLVRSRRSAP
jgi:disulfide bond formation protein DsbB